MKPEIAKKYVPSKAEIERDYVPKYPHGYVPRDIVSTRLVDSPTDRRPQKPAVFALTDAQGKKGRERGSKKGVDIIASMNRARDTRNARGSKKV